MATMKVKDKQLKDKLTLRRSLLSTLETVKAFMDNYEEERDFPQVPVWLEILDQAFQDCLKVQSEIEKMDNGDAPLVKHLQERHQFQSRYCATKGWLMNRRLLDLNSTINVHDATPAQPTSFHLRLPKIDLPKFDGDYSRWLGFRDTFKSMVHDVKDIPLVAKLQFLLQSLEGEARTPYETVDIVAANYVITWEALLKRYDNKRFLTKQLYRTLHDLAPIRKESAQDLHHLVDDFQRHVKALAKLGELVETWDTPLICMLSYKMDPATLRAWEEYAAKSDNVGYEACIEFLYQRIRILQTVSTEIQHRSQAAPAKVAGPHSFSKKLPTTKAVANSATASSRPSPPSCIACPEKHLLFQCSAFQRMTVEQRRELISQKRLCWNCFKSSHIARRCDSKYTCRHCHERHHTLLHKSSSDPAAQSTPQYPTQQANSHGSGILVPEVSVPAHSSSPSTVFLSTVSLWIEDRFGRQHSARALIDSGSQSNFISKKLARRLCLQSDRVRVPIAGIGETTVTVTQSVISTIHSKNNEFSSKLEFLVLPNPTSELPTSNVDISMWKIPSNFPLADPAFNVSSPIDLLLGIEQFHEYIMSGRIILGKGCPVLFETVFGWAVIGRCYGTTPPTTPVCHIATTRNLESLLERFWELESLQSDRIYSAKEIACEELYQGTTTRKSDGRYVVSLPKSQDPYIQLGESRAIAERRLLCLERKLERDASVKEAYHEFLEEYSRLGHMRRLEDPVDNSIYHYYLPHHPVFKASSTTTKVRVVFDASCRTSSGSSLNDLLLVGPIVQEDLQSIKLRFRTKPIGLVADIEKMFRQIAVCRNDQPLLRILFRQKPTDPISTYELQTVTYGTSSASFLSTRTLVQLATDEGENFPMAKKAVLEDFYVDDLISGASTPEEDVELRRQLSAMLQSAGFPLRKWASNSSAVLAEIPSEELAIQPVYEFADEQSVSTLGLIWEPHSDTLRFRIQLTPPAVELTRRNVLSYIAKIYDPLGLAGPVISTAKQFMQRLWALKNNDGNSYAWDDPLPTRIQDEWKAFHYQLNLVSDVRIPRFVSVAGATSFELHFFSDASERAYGTCVYMRSEDQRQNVVVHLLAAKSRVTPLKTRHSIARLELCAAVLSTDLFLKVIASLKSNFPVFFWVDSMTVLQWLKASPNRWKTFVGNRVSKIQIATVGHPWYHVSGKDNPADDISRGLTPAELLHQERWWTGPAWLKQTKKHWPSQLVDSVASSKAVVEECKVCLAALISPTDQLCDWLFNCFSSYTKLRKAVAYFLRYMGVLHATAAKKHPDGACAASSKTPCEPHTHLTASDLQDAEHVLCQLSQRETFPTELKALRNGRPVDKTSPMKFFNPMLSKDGLIKVGGRIQDSNSPEGMKHPIIISSKHRLAHLLADHYHRTLMHAGPQLMTTTIRQKFWILRGRDLLRQVYHQCHTCFRRKPVLIQQATADLPNSRVTSSRPFSVSGVDYCGPILLRGPHRRAGPVKAYIALFVCFSTRAVHLELVSDLSTAAFLAALKRFIARRGKVCELHSDNATNFKGAANELHLLFKMLKTDDSSRKLIFDWCANAEIRWKFIPPRAPHFGGLWEAAVKSAKSHLLKEVGNTTVTHEEMLTLLAQVEMCLNSRPITEMSNDPTDLEALTPGHFLVGSNLQSIPEADYKQLPDNKLNRWQLMQKRLQAIWKRWSTEYLQQLQARSSKGIKPPVDIRVGRLVIIKDDNLPPAQWMLGRITKIHPAHDGIVRVVTLKTASADNVVRPVVKLSLLPMPSNVNDVENEVIK
ncbi:uncharacterized protein LOC129773538 [Toxorhynchites rutilus septentrionalis]|uniref:uncharacterized protein LOC129773538 n=1 Tax=Toxorhynchites rutilus septentrionalis TaxID=329112 RepID=UPI00247A1657|nr:uncharacterized protein LOC129773538 [Toxorhynchites rutilus septentrionalis]